MRGFSVILLALLVIGSARADDAPAGGGLAPADSERLIRERIRDLQALQRELHRAAGNDQAAAKAARAEWDTLVERVLGLRASMAALDELSADSPSRPASEAKLFSTLQELGVHLDAATHPSFAPRLLGPPQVAEMDRLEAAIGSLTFGPRDEAFPVRLLGPEPLFTLIHLPVPLAIQSRPGDTLYLAAGTGGAFPNGLSLIELVADDQGLARTTWVSIGEAVGDCTVTLHSAAAIEPREIRIRVVAPSLTPPEGLPQPEALAGEIPRLKPSLPVTETRAIPR